MDSGTATPVTYSIADLPDVLKISRSRIFEEIAAERLRSYPVGRRRCVSHQAVLDWINDRENEKAPDG